MNHDSWLLTECSYRSRWDSMTLHPGFQLQLKMFLQRIRRSMKIIAYYGSGTLVRSVCHISNLSMTVWLASDSGVEQSAEQEVERGECEQSPEREGEGGKVVLISLHTVRTCLSTHIWNINEVALRLLWLPIIGGWTMSPLLPVSAATLPILHLR